MSCLEFFPEEPIQTVIKGNNWWSNTFIKRELLQCTTVVLAHQTSEKNLHNIEKLGILPAGDERIQRVKDRIETDPFSVYLVGNIDSTYFRRVQVDHNGIGIAIIVNVNISDLEGDENTDPRSKELHGVDSLIITLGNPMRTCKHIGFIEPNKFLYAIDSKGIVIRKYGKQANI